MLRFPNWTWAPSRFGVDRNKSQGSGSPVPARPCLPSVEKLDGRLLFSVSLSDISIVKHIDKSTPTLAVAESNVLTQIPGANLDSNYKGQFAGLTHDFLKVNDILLKYEQDILNDKVTPTEGADTTQALNDLFIKIDSLATTLDGGTGQLLPAVQKVYDLALGTGREGSSGSSILSDLNNLADQLKISPYPDAEADGLAKMAGDFWKLSEVALNYKLDLIQGVPTEVAQKEATTKAKMEYLKIELEQVLVSGFVSSSDQKDLNATLDGAFNLVNGVINPSTPTVGITTPAVAGDTIS
jgi:type VI protein secretion system component Hcp